MTAVATRPAARPAPAPALALLSVPAAASMADIITFIQEHAEAHDIDAILEAAKLRRETLSSTGQPAICEGTRISLSGLFPEGLNGLLGAIEGIGCTGTHVCVRLDPASTESLRGTSFHVSDDNDGCLLRGIPVDSCTPHDEIPS